MLFLRTTGSIRRSDHPSFPSAMICSFFSSLKTLLTLKEGNPRVWINVLDQLAGFVITEVNEPVQPERSHFPGLRPPPTRPNF